MPPPAWICNENNQCVATIDGNDIDAATSLAKEADVSILLLASFSKEGSDRDNLSFDGTDSSTCQFAQKNQDNMVNAVAKASKRTVVAGVSPGAILMPWRSEVNAILLSFFPGEAYGWALMDVLTGKVNPSAKLPITMPNSENDQQMSRKQYPGVNKKEEYSEGLMVDYRYYSTFYDNAIYEFGHGLSYTSFGYSDLVITNVSVPADTDFSVSTTVVAIVTAIVKNTGNVAGKEVAQMYITFPLVANSPKIQLKGYQKTASLGAGASQRVSFSLTVSDLSVWNVDTHAWTVVVGDFGIKIGSSSADIRLKGKLSIPPV